MPQTLKDLLKQQHVELDDLATEFQRKEITASRVIRLMRIVQRNVEISEELFAILDRAGLTKDPAAPDDRVNGVQTVS